MRLKLFEESIHISRPFHDKYGIIINNIITYIGNYGNHPIYISKTVPRFWGAQCGYCEESHCEEIYINDEVYELLQESPEFERFLETICEHEVRYGHRHHKHGPRTDRELEVLEFFKKQGVVKDY